MMKYFMILTPEINTTKSGYLWIYEPEELESRDYTETWFNHIFPILGNFSDSISEKLLNPNVGGEFSEEFYRIKNFKIIKKNQANRRLSIIRIYL
jgi:predicted SAM-dependent methyltransferase